MDSERYVHADKRIQRPKSQLWTRNQTNITNNNKIKVCFPFVGNSIGGSHISTLELISSLDKNLFEDFKLNRDKIYNLDNVYSAEILKRSVKIKGDIVSQDEFETGEERIKLNYGHTVGHAIEKVSNFNSYLHGEAVSIGMMVAIKISEKIGMIDKSSEIEQKAILENYNLPTFAKNLDKSKIFEAIKMDKKNVDGKVKWVLLNSIGKAQIVRGIDESIVKEAISEVIL